MSDTIQLKAEARDRVGKGAARELRRNGMVPAVIYGDKKDPLAIAIPYRELSMKLHGGGFMTTITEIEVGGEKHRVLAKDYQLHPVRDFIEHVDFLRIAKGAKVVVEIPVRFINEEDSPGIKRGGVLNVVRHTVEVECPADAIPDALVGDLSGLDINDGLHISAFDIPEGVIPTITDRDFTVATIAASAGAKEELRAEEEGDEMPETEIIGEESDEEQPETEDGEEE